MEHLRRLELWDYATPPALLEALPRFQHLTSMALALLPGDEPPPGIPGGAGGLEHFDAAMAQWDRVAMHAVLRCGQLRELQLGGSCLCDSGFEHLPPGSLPQLTRLECRSDYAVHAVPPQPLCELPALRVLCVDG
jgi:hypothetical protein